MIRKSILVVEDDEVVRTMIRDFLEKEYTVIDASRCSEAVSKISHHHIDLALIDYALPDGDGFELLKVIRQTNTQLPVIMITAYGTEIVVIRALRTGVTDYIKKPLKLSYLKKRISELLTGLTHQEDFELEYVESRKDFILDSIAFYIEEHFMEDFTLNKVAGRVGMNKFNFCRLFKERFGQGFISYLNCVRIKNAAELLKGHNLNITEIAYFVGYKSFTQFERIFKRMYGIPPREYRKQINENL
ncbi:MAG: response regulator [Nitrospinota bacterium]